MERTWNRPESIWYSPSAMEKPIFADALFLLLDKRRGELADFSTRLMKKGGEDSVHDLRVAGRRLLEWAALFKSLAPPLLIHPAEEALEDKVSALSRLRNQDIFLKFLE